MRHIDLVDQTTAAQIRRRMQNSYRLHELAALYDPNLDEVEIVSLATMVNPDAWKKREQHRERFLSLEAAIRVQAQLAAERAMRRAARHARRPRLIRFVSDLFERRALAA